MILSKSNLVHFLLDRGLVSAATVAEGRFAAREILRHNRTFSVSLGGAPGLFLKQPILWDTTSVQCVEREAACYRRAAETPEWAPLRALLPRLVDFVPERTALVVELLHEAESLQDHHARYQRFPAGTARRLGAALAAYHRMPPRVPGAEPPPCIRSWVLQPGLSPEFLAGEPRLAWVVEQVDAVPELRAALAALAAEWREDALVHGDIKWENCLAWGGDGGDAEPELRLVDWEMAGLGDSAWDVGSALHAYLYCWVVGMPLQAAASPQALLDAHAYPVSAMHPALRAFWRAYVEGRGLPREEARAFLRRAARYAGARLIQTTWEYARSAAGQMPYAHLLLQLGMNVVLRPGQACTVLFGLEGEA